MTNKLLSVKLRAEALEIAYRAVEQEAQYLGKDYKMVEKNYKQKTDWRTGELQWEDEEKTIPKMEDRWDYVDIPEDELGEDVKLKIQVYKDVLEDINGLI